MGPPTDKDVLRKWIHHSPLVKNAWLNHEDAPTILHILPYAKFTLRNTTLPPQLASLRIILHKPTTDRRTLLPPPGRSRNN